MSRISSSWLGFGAGFGLGVSMGVGISAFIQDRWVTGDLKYVVGNNTNETSSKSMHSGFWKYCVEDDCDSTVDHKALTDDGKCPK